jgi:hypothetical protein
LPGGTGKSQKITVRIASVPDKTETEHLPNTVHSSTGTLTCLVTYNHMRGTSILHIYSKWQLRASFCILFCWFHLYMPLYKSHSTNFYEQYVERWYKLDKTWTISHILTAMTMKISIF